VICKNQEQTDGRARVTLDEKEILHPGTLTPMAERQSARMSKITNDTIFVLYSCIHMATLGVNGLIKHNSAFSKKKLHAATNFVLVHTCT